MLEICHSDLSVLRVGCMSSLTVEMHRSRPSFPVRRSTEIGRLLATWYGLWPQTKCIKMGNWPIFAEKLDIIMWIILQKANKDTWTKSKPHQHILCSFFYQSWNSCNVSHEKIPKPVSQLWRDLEKLKTTSHTHSSQNSRFEKSSDAI